VEWGQGCYEVIAEQLLPAAEVVVEQAAPGDRDRLLDVGCGTGNAALLAAERGATVTGVDPAQRLIDVAAEESERRGLDGTFVLGEAADIPLPGSSIDIVISVFGAIFAPDPRAAVAEMARVLDPAGRMFLSAWIPDGAISRAVRLSRQTVAEVLGQPPPAPPFPWHEQEALEELFDRHGWRSHLPSTGFRSAPRRRRTSSSRRVRTTPSPWPCARSSSRRAGPRSSATAC
jgi:ubiquinone/menaquinone biosynthesis C-methylase UbiE